MKSTRILTLLTALARAAMHAPRLRLARLCALAIAFGAARAEAELFIATADNGTTNIIGTLDTSTGIFTQTGTTTGLTMSLTTGSNGTLYGTNYNGAPYAGLETVSPTGTTAQYGTVSAPSGSYFGGYLGLASAGSAGFFADYASSNGGATTIVQISADGQTSNTLGSAYDDQTVSGNLAFGPNGNLYVEYGNRSSSVLTLFQVSTTTGAMTEIGSGLGPADGLALGSSATTLYGVDDVMTNGAQTIYGINTTTGVATATGVTVSGLASGYEFDTLTLSPSVVPEPASVMMMGCGLGLAGLMAWRKHRRAATA